MAEPAHPPTRTFHLGDVLSITTGRLVSPRQMEGVYDILEWLTGEQPESTQIPRLTDECRGPLLAQHPDLAAVTRPEVVGREAVARWLAEQVAVYGETRDVEPLAGVERTLLDALDEAQLLNPDMMIIAEMPREPES
jgi:hypothetical protein